MPTSYGVDQILERMTAAEVGEFSPKIDRNSQTWKAVKKYIEDQISCEFSPMLRKRDSDHNKTQYARGGFDALEGLLEFGGENI